MPCGGGESMQARSAMRALQARTDSQLQSRLLEGRQQTRGGDKQTRPCAVGGGGGNSSSKEGWRSKRCKSHSMDEQAEQGGVNRAHQTQMHPASRMQGRDRWGPPCSTASLFFWEPVGQRGRWQGDSAWASGGGRACPNQPGRSSCPPRASPLLGVVLCCARTVCGESPSPITFPSTPRDPIETDAGGRDMEGIRTNDSGQALSIRCSIVLDAALTANVEIDCAWLLLEQVRQTQRSIIPAQA